MAKIRKKMTSKERLTLHQLRIAEWYESWKGNNESEENNKIMASSTSLNLPEKWVLTRGVNLYNWQQECVDNWFNNNYSGTVKVVTGAGKTLLALSIAERLQNEINPNLRIAITVPTVVLMLQWQKRIKITAILKTIFLRLLEAYYFQLRYS